jgi:DNA polymerase-1
MKCALVVDGNSLIYRLFYASFAQLEYYKKNNLQPLNAVKLILLVTLKLLKNKNYDYVLYAFDHGKKTLRHDEFAEYKSGRKPMPEDLVSQLGLIKDAINVLNIKQMSLEGIEADDIIGSATKLFNEQDVLVDIYSSDKDMLQLVNDKTTVNLFKTGISDILTVTPNNFAEVFFDLLPHQVCDFKGISGDSSDNLTGVKGIGPKTASELIKQYGCLESIYENIDKLSEGQKQKFNNCKENAIMCKKLSTIDKNVLNCSIDEFKYTPAHMQDVRNFIYQFKFSGFDKYLND